MYKLSTIGNRLQQDVRMWNNVNLNELEHQFRYREISCLFDRLINKEDLALEAGCGIGQWVYKLTKEGKNIIGIDYIFNSLLTPPKAVASLKFLQGNILELPFPDNCFDAYISLGVIEHFEDGPEKALLEAKRVLKENGLALIAVPHLNILRKLIAHPMRDLAIAYMKIIKRNICFREYRFTKHELCNAISNAGFQIIDVQTDDFCRSQSDLCIGIYADFPFFRGKSLWALNLPGKMVFALLKAWSPWIYSSGIMVIAKKK